MKDLVSNRRTGVFALAASISVVWLIFIFYGFPSTALLGVSLAFSAAYWMATHSTRSITNVIDDIKAEPVLAVVRPAPKAPR
jgi:hypothetical protein